ncbi:GNAT family N-acetyltransferase [Sediminitomix flava]|uniref:Acetyltransferase (GNAT) family protein n=1 Tax=Sediminitomix flava TaxID=379075 RepID=A0A315Z9N8_SEDFL|nr:GNAT family N-acetyltransferase [Sediminitomix flava]PWJ40914.1 acetyltransferase (GNAT) family protein [Sediminitomix flava]
MLKIIEFKEASEHVWNQFYLKTPLTTYFSSLEWNKFWEKTSDGKYKKALAYEIHFNDGVKAVLPTLKVNILKSLSVSHIASVYGTYISLLSHEEITFEHYKVLSNYLRRKWKVYQLYFMPFSFNGLYQKSDTHIINFKEINNYSKGHIRNLKKSKENSNLRIFQVHSEAEWRSFYALYQKNLNRWKKVNGIQYDWSIFDQLSQVRSPSIQLWVVKNQKDEIISGAIFLLGNSVVNYWLGASSTEGLDHRANFLLFDQLLHQFKKLDFTYFDLGPSTNLNGVERFKEGFGAKRQTFSYLEQKNSLLKIVARLNNLRS